MGLALSVAGKVRREFLKAVLQPDDVLTYTAVGADGSTTTKAMQVVCHFSGRERVVETYAGASSSAEISVQYFRVWRRRSEASPPTSLTVIYESDPVSIQLANLAASLSKLRETLFSWKRVASGTVGCCDLVEPTRPEARFVDDPAKPVLLLLEDMHGKGWAPRASVVEHRRGERSFSIVNVSGKASYLRVLLAWENYPALENFRSDLPVAFFDCVLAGKRAPPGLSAKEYKKRLGQRAEDPPDALEDASPRAIDDEPDEDAVVRALSERVDAIEDIVHAPRGDGDGAASSRSYKSSTSSSSTSSSSSSETSEVASEANFSDTDAVHAPAEEIKWPSHI